MTAKRLPTFEVDKDGLRKLLDRRPPGFAVWELVQNAWDEDITRVDIVLRKLGRGTVLLRVEDDDPEGFTDLRHAYTLFAESEKKVDATKRGRFNLGEKFVIAICKEARIATTTGTITFADGYRTHSRAKTDRGSVFEGTLRMTDADYEQTVQAVNRLIPPPGITTTFNGEQLAWREPVKTFSEILASEIADDEGRLKRTFRKADIALYEPLPDETAAIYEMGIPVVETGDRWHVDIGQKVPLNVDRDNVTPSYLQDVRRVVLDNAHDLIDKDTAAETWVTDAVEDKDVSAEAVEAFVKKRFGDKVVKADPSDPEAEKLAVSQGYTILHSRTLPKAVQTHIKTHEIVKPAGQVTPSPKPYQAGQGSNRKTLPTDQWTDGMKAHAGFAQELAERLLGVGLLIEIVNDQACMNFGATYQRGLPTARLEYNLRTLGRKYFERDPVRREHIDILIHEFGHQRESDHLDRKYLEALTDLGAKATMLALEEPDLFLKHAAKTLA